MRRIITRGLSAIDYELVVDVIRWEIRPPVDEHLVYRKITQNVMVTGA